MIPIFQSVFMQQMNLEWLNLNSLKHGLAGLLFTSKTRKWLAHGVLDRHTSVHASLVQSVADEIMCQCSHMFSQLSNIDFIFILNKLDHKLTEKQL